jgi:hypothetical protein
MNLEVSDPEQRIFDIVCTVHRNHALHGLTELQNTVNHKLLMMKETIV